MDLDESFGIELRLLCVCEWLLVQTMSCMIYHLKKAP